MLDRPTIRNICTEINNALADIANRYKLTVKPVNCSFNTIEMGVRATFQVIGESGENMVDKKRWNAYAALYGLKPDDFGREIVVRGARYRLMACNAKCKKYPFVVQSVLNGKLYKMDAWSIQMAMGVPANSIRGERR